jgi:TRAP-type mannitol/chloroaromatic compound transport system permease small subunit
VLLILQGVAEAIRRVRVLRGVRGDAPDEPDPRAAV